MSKPNDIKKYSNNLKIHPLPTQASELKSPPMMEKIGLVHPFSLSIYGASSSGKTVALVNLFTNPNMYGGYFDEKWLFGPTGKCDDSFASLKIKDDHIVTKEYIPRLDTILKDSQEEVSKKGLLKSKKRLIIFEDLTSLWKLMHSESFVRCFVQVRHHNMSVAASCHKYKALERTSRLNSKHHMVFPACSKELMHVVDEHHPPNLSTKEFVQMVNHAWTPDGDNVRPFFWIKCREPVETRFSKSLHGQYNVRPLGTATNIDSGKYKEENKEETEEQPSKKRKMMPKTYDNSEGKKKAVTN